MSIAPSQSLSEIFGRDVGLIATIDHPFTTPPAHVLDGHLRVMQQFGDSAMLLNWDVSTPHDRRYRYDLITDTGLLSKHRLLYHYTPDEFYGAQQLNPTPWTVLAECLAVAVRALAAKYRLSAARSASLQSSAERLIALAESAYHPGIQPWAYTSTLTIQLYNEFGQNDLADYLAGRCFGYWQSKLMIDWIPWCIENVQGALAINNLLRGNTFERNPFRPISHDAAYHSEQDPKEIAYLIHSGSLLPSFDVFLWSLAVARVRHYGNDRGFFLRLATTTGDASIAELQTSAEWEDCHRFLQIAEDYGVMVDIEGDRVNLSNRTRNPSKLTRITSLGAFYVLAGESASDIIVQYRRGGFQSRTISLT